VILLMEMMTALQMEIQRESELGDLLVHLLESLVLLMALVSWFLTIKFFITTADGGDVLPDIEIERTSPVCSIGSTTLEKRLMILNPPISRPL